MGFVTQQVAAPHKNQPSRAERAPWILALLHLPPSLWFKFLLFLILPEKRNISVCVMIFICREPTARAPSSGEKKRHVKIGLCAGWSMELGKIMKSLPLSLQIFTSQDTRYVAWLLLPDLNAYKRCWDYTFVVSTRCYLWAILKPDPVHFFNFSVLMLNFIFHSKLLINKVK